MASQQKIAGNLSRRQIGWMAPLTVMIGRSVFMILAQGLVALGYAARGHPSPWNAAAHWWTVYATLVDIGCLALMVKFTRVEGIKLRDLIGPIRLRRGRDVVLGLVCFLIYLVSFTFPGLLASKLVFGTTQPSMYPGLLTARNLPLWAVVYSFSLWWIIWSPTEEMTYNGYALPRTQALTGSKLIAVLIVAFWWAIQHSFIPFILDWKYVVWRFLFFLPGVVIACLIYLRIRHLAPLILAHWAMDLMGAIYTLSL
jgi:membrane protease YdiL (CAAX protease family)